MPGFVLRSTEGGVEGLRKYKTKTELNIHILELLCEVVMLTRSTGKKRKKNHGKRQAKVVEVIR